MNHSRDLMMMLLRVSPRTMLLLILGLAAAVTWLVNAELEKNKLANTAPPPIVRPKTRVVVCAHNIAEGATIAAEDLTVEEADPLRVPADVINDPLSAVGHQCKFMIMSGNFLSAHDIAPLQASTGFQSKLLDGERAVTMAVDNTTGVAGFISPDSHVDVMVQVGAGAEAKARAILSDVRVVATGTVYQRSRGETVAQPTSTVTVAVSPENAASLINAMAIARIYLTLRSDHDHTPIAVSDIHSLLKPAPRTAVAFTGTFPLPPPPPAQRASSVTQVLPTDETAPNPFHGYDVEQWAGSKKDLTPIRQL